MTVLMAAGCTTTARSGSVKGTSTSDLATTTTTGQVAPPVSSSSTLLAGPSGPGYEAARAQWLGEGLVGGGAAQNIPFELALAELRSGESTDSGNRSGYPAAIEILKNLTSFPDANVSSAQEAQFNQWAAQLDAFFETSAAVQGQSCFENITPQSKTAAKMWSQEPAGTTNGIAIGPLQNAVAELGQAPPTTPCYAAAIDDLIKLESATPAEIAATSVTSSPQSQDTILVGGRIIYLNAFFETDGAVGPNWNGVLHS